MVSAGNGADVSQILEAIDQGEGSAVESLLGLLYEELRALAASYLRREGREHTLQPTALVHEAFLKLVDQRRVNWRGRTHFLAVGAQAMRRVLVDHARSKKRHKRGGGLKQIALPQEIALSPNREEDLLAVDEVLTKLAAVDARQARIVELRFFGGLTVQEIAEHLGVSKRTVESEWTMVRAWLRRELSAD